MIRPCLVANLPTVSANAFITSLRPYLRPLGGATACLLGTGALTLLYPAMGARLVSELAGSARIPGGILALLGALVVLQSLLAYGGARLAGDASEGIVRDLRARVFEGFLTLAPERWEAHSRGDRLSRISNDTNVLGFFLGSTLPNAMPQATAAVGAVAVLLWRDPLAALALLAVVVVIIFGVRCAGAGIRQAAGRALDRQGDLYATADESLIALPITRAFAVESESAEQFAVANSRLFLEGRNYLRRAALVAPLTRAGGALALLALFGLLLASNTRPVGGDGMEETVALLFYGLVAIRPLGTLSGVYTRLEQARAALRRVIAEEAPSILCTDGADTNSTAQPGHASASGGALVARSLRYAYPGRGSLIEHVDLDLRPGQTTLVYGRNGSGKSTLVYLLLRFLQPTAGTLALDGRTLESHDAAAWRRQIGYVPQQPLLQNATVRWNLTLGRNIAEEDLVRALDDAQASDFVAALPEGLETRLHDRGAGLSGGQQQRLALARAIVARPRFLILDEATSMLDRESVATLVASSKRWSGGCGVLIVTHDRALHTLADSVFELRDGRLHR